MNTSTSDAQQGMGGFLGWIERSGNKLPDPVFLFFWLILGLVAISVLAAMTGVSAAHPTKIDPATGTNQIISATSLLSAENIAKLWVDMPKTFTHFHPLGYVLVVNVRCWCCRARGSIWYGHASRRSGRAQRAFNPDGCAGWHAR
jgi:aminobenzoyl-glutamate transport protein